VRLLPAKTAVSTTIKLVATGRRRITRTRPVRKKSGLDRGKWTHVLYGVSENESQKKLLQGPKNQKSLCESQNVAKGGLKMGAAARRSSGEERIDSLEQKRKGKKEMALLNLGGRKIEPDSTHLKENLCGVDRAEGEAPEKIHQMER